MQENYIKIFSQFLGELYESGQMAMPDIAGLMKVFEPVAAWVDSREKLIQFLKFYLKNYPVLQQLIDRLEDRNYNFNLNLK